MALKNYDTQNWPKEDKAKFVKSGVKSPNSDNEMLVVMPLEAHPQMKGFYKAIDPADNWQGWVEYNPAATPAPTPTPAETAKSAWLSKYVRLQKLLSGVKNGIIAANDTRISTLQGELLADFKDEYLDIL